ncbi:phBC6A51 family helix-turn-helix protein [Enterococcus asini]|uniref:phBC6A51 family helix-turn-helix protein n=1 Tax=Enterococcus asini TaxID=57732 RepID=UPI00288F726A|nr:phBC6A51 family helix-turn-helix protein [Enterococcus asini]MDT2743018.1 phBC6A51 family helix-turn-helix protein [Enterococcus asini]
MTLKKLTTSNKLTPQQEQFIELYCDNENKMTQQEIANALGVSRKTVSRWKNDPGPVRTEIEKKEKLRALGLLSLANNAMEDILQNGSDTARVKAAEYALRMNGLLQNGASEEITKEEKPPMSVEEALQKYGMGGSTIKEAEKADFPQLDQPHDPLDTEDLWFK